VDRIEGSYSNVVGLPVSLVVRLLAWAARPGAFDDVADGNSSVGPVLA
jgi:hypothetical protein